MPDNDNKAAVKVSADIANYAELKTKSELKKVMDKVKREAKSFEKNKSFTFQTKSIEMCLTHFDETPEKNFNALLEYTGVAVSQLNFILLNSNND